VGLRDLFKRFEKREDAEALKRAEEMKLESPAEREISKGDIEGMAADEQAGLMLGEPSIEHADRLAERDDE
jgi:hypothetical protein